jgi:hypothetical protein
LVIYFGFSYGNSRLGGKLGAGLGLKA